MNERFIVASAIALATSLNAATPVLAESADGGRQPEHVEQLDVDPTLGAQLEEFALKYALGAQQATRSTERDAAVVAEMLPLMRSVFVVKDEDLAATRAARYFSQNDAPRMGDYAVVNRFVILANIYHLLSELKRDELINEREVQYCRNNSFNNPSDIKSVLSEIWRLHRNLEKMVKDGVVSANEEREFRANDTRSFELTAKLVKRMEEWEVRDIPDDVKKALDNARDGIIEGGFKKIEEDFRGAKQQ